MSKVFVIGCALTLLAVVLPPAASGQAGALEKKLATAKRLECRFTTLATGTWDGATPSVQVTPVKLEAKFHDIDVDEGTAEADSDFGASFISVRYSHGYLHLMQVSDAGPLYVTTVFAAETTNGRLKAVQTRHEFSPAIVPGFTSRPETYVGDCAVSG